MDPENTVSEEASSAQKKSAKILFRFPPPENEKPPIKSDFDFDTDVHEKIQFFEKRNKAVESVKKSIADYVNRSIEDLLEEYSTRDSGVSTEESQVSEQIKEYILTGTAAPTVLRQSNEFAPIMEILYRDLKANRSNKLLKKFIRTLAYKIKQKTKCSDEEIESVGPVIQDVIQGILAKKMLSHKIEQLLGFQKDPQRRIDFEERGEEVFNVNAYRVKVGWKVVKKRKADEGGRIKKKLSVSTETDDLAGQTSTNKVVEAKLKRKRRRSRRKNSANERVLTEPGRIAHITEQEELQKSIKELVERKITNFQQSEFSRFEANSGSTPEPEQTSSGSSQCNLAFMNSLDSSAIKIEDREITKINRISRRKSLGKIDRKGKRIKLKGSPPVTKWEKQLMSSSLEESHNPSSPSNQSAGLLRQNELKERKEERNRKKQHNVCSERPENEDEGVNNNQWWAFN